ncbi:MAG: LysR family transcriptional regulator [Pyramidobacter sp.]
MEKDMLYAYEVYKCGSFSKAAEKLYISQPALSAIIKKLEQRLNAQLFDRHKTPVSLTPSGVYFIDCIEKINAIENSYKSYFDDLSQLNKGSVKIGTSTHLCSKILPDIVARFSALYPELEFYIVEDNSTPSLKKMLRNAEIDLTLSSNNYPTDEFAEYPFCYEDIILAVREDNRINRGLEQYRIAFDEIRDKSPSDCPQKPLPISVFKDEPFLTIKKTSDLYGRLIAMFDECHEKVRIIHDLEQMSTCYFLAARGYGVTLIRASTLDFVRKMPELCFYKIDSPLARRVCRFYVKKNVYRTKAVRTFLDFIQSQSEVK